MKSPLPPSGDTILTTGEAARLLGVAVSTAQLWMQSGALPSWKTPGGHRRVLLSAVMRLIDQTNLDKHSTSIISSENSLINSEFLPEQNPLYPVPFEEPARLLAVNASKMVDTDSERVFDRLTFLAAQVTQSPMALMTLLTSRRQWFKSRVGVNLMETPRSWAFCSYAILSNDPFVVEDAACDIRFQDNPLVLGEPYIRFYAAVPILDINGHRLGTLCVLDREARKLRNKELTALSELAAIATEEIKRRH